MFRIIPCSHPVPPLKSNRPSHPVCFSGRLKSSVLVLLLGFLLCLATSFWGLQSCTASNPNLETANSEKFTNVQSSGDLRFAVIGDSGSGTEQQKLLADQMFRQYLKTPFAMVLMLGDNIYPVGDVKRYGFERFLKPYAALLDKKVPFYPALGNHDVIGGFQEESIAFFKMPAAYYQIHRGETDFFALNTNNFNDVQRAWLEDRLKSSQAKWKIVYAHHPVFSSGLHRNNKLLIKVLKPILEKNQVNLYLAGHDHDYERFNLMNGVSYVVSGGGGAYLRKFEGIQPGSNFRLSRHHFMLFTVRQDGLYFEAIDIQGNVFDSGRFPVTKLRSRRPAA